jgi:hypothetical protein
VNVSLGTCDRVFPFAYVGTKKATWVPELLLNVTVDHGFDIKE